MTPLPDPARTLDRLNSAVIAAHEAGDGMRLARLYGEAADAISANGDIASACFFYTQAYVFALEHGSPEAGRYAAILRRHGRL